MDFLFRRLDVYRISIDIAENIEKVCLIIQRKENRVMADQFRKAALSIPLNIAEGNGRPTCPDKTRLLIIARGSCFELIPLLELAERLRHIDHHQRKELGKDIGSISRMLSALVISLTN